MSDIKIDQRQFQELLQALSKAIGGSTNAFSRRQTQDPDEVADKVSSRRARKASSTLASAQDKLTKENISLVQALYNYRRTLKYSTDGLLDAADVTDEYKDSVRAMNRSLSNASDIIEEMRDETYRLSGSMNDQAVQLTRGTRAAKSLTSSFAQSTVNSSIFGASLLESHDLVKKGSSEYYRMVDNLSAASKPLNKGLLKSAGVWDSSADALKQNLDTSDFAKIRLAIGATEAVISEDLSNINFSSMQGLMDDTAANWSSMLDRIKADSEGGLRHAITSMVTKLESQGVDLGVEWAGQKIKTINASGDVDTAVIDMLNDTPEVLEKFVNAIGDVSRQNTAAMGQMNKQALAANSMFHKLKKSVSGITPLFDKLSDKIDELGETSVIAANFGNALAKIQAAYREASAFNIAMVPESFLAAQLASVRLGMSFEETVAFMQQNKRAIALLGGDTARYGNELKDTFAKFGYSFKQASEVLPSMNEAAMAFGVNMRDATAIEGFVDSTMSAFTKLAKITDITAAEFAKLETALLNDADVRANLIGMDAARAREYAIDIRKIREHYVELGLSAEAANDLIAAQEKAKRAPLKERMQEAAKASLLARQLGMSSAEANQIMTIAMKGRGASAQEQEQLRKLFGDLAVRGEQAIQSGADSSIAAGAIMQQLVDSLLGGQVYSELQKSGMTEQQAVRTKTAVTQEELESLPDVKGNENFAKASNIINTVSSLLQNSLAGAAGFSALALMGMSTMAIKAAFALGTIGKGGILGKILGKIGDLLLRRGGRGAPYTKPSTPNSGTPRTVGQATRPQSTGAPRPSTPPTASPKVPMTTRAADAISRSAASLTTAGSRLATSVSTAATTAATTVSTAATTAVGAVNSTKSSFIRAAGDGAVKVLSKAAVPLAVAGAMYEGYSGWSEANEKLELGQISQRDAKVEKGKAVGGAVGTAGGGMAGAALGATIGTMIFPGVGTVLGGFIGGALGAFGGNKAGSELGEIVADKSIAPETSRTPPPDASSKLATATIPMSTYNPNTGPMDYSKELPATAKAATVSATATAQDIYHQRTLELKERSDIRKEEYLARKYRQQQREATRNVAKPVESADTYTGVMTGTARQQQREATRNVAKPVESADTYTGVMTGLAQTVPTIMPFKQPSGVTQPGVFAPPSISNSKASEPVKTGASKTVNNESLLTNKTTSEDDGQIVQVEDINSRNYLAQIAKNMAEAVALLQTVAENGSPAAMAALTGNSQKHSSLRPLPTSMSYLTGRHTT